MSLISITHANIKNRNKTLFEDLTLQIENGECLAIVGPAGSGKTALLKTIAGEYFVAKGTIKHQFYHDFRASHNITDPLFSHRHMISYVDVKHNFTNLSNTHDFFYQQRFNASYADEAQTVEEHLSDIAKDSLMEGPWNMARVIGEFDLQRLRNKHLIKLSNGETRRLRIAAALLKNPSILLLDNPLTGLDVDRRTYFEGLFKKIVESGITLIMVTSPHQLPEVVTQIVVIDHNSCIKSFPRSAFHPDQVNLKSNALPIPSIQNLPLWSNQTQAKPFEILVEMKNVQVRYGNTKVLEGINWTVKPGEHWALSGPNGSGKSTLLSLIYGDHPQAYSNDIVLFDRPRGTGESIWDIKKNIGFMSPELFQYFPDQYTCLQVVESGFYDTVGLYQHVTEAERLKALDWMKVMGTAELKDMLFSDISSTLQRLCLLTRALVKSPTLLILDEPCQEFDRSQQRYFRALIDAIAKQSHLSMIYVTHHREELPECINNELKLQ
jgi:molybdate transport system ATP-binding protein